MKLNFWRGAVLEALLGLLFLLPFLLVLSHVWRMQLELWQIAARWLTAFALGTAIGGWRLRRYARWGLIAAMAAGIGFFPYGLPAALAGLAGRNWLAAALMTAAAAWAVRLGAMYRRGYRLPFGYYAAGAALYGAVSLPGLIHKPVVANETVLHGYGLVALTVCFFKLNRLQLNRAELSPARGRLTAGKVTAINRIGTALLLLIVILLAHVRRLREWLAAAYDLLIAGISALLPEEPSVPPQPQQLPAEGGAMPLLPEPEGTSPFWAALEEMLMKLAAPAGIGLAALLLYLAVVRVFLPFLRRWFAFMSSRQEEIGYIDETEKLTDYGIGRLLKRAARRMREARPKEPLDNRQRVRRAYRDMLREAIKAGYVHEASRTPLETARALADVEHRLSRPVGKLTALYNKARYQEAHIHDAELKDV